jgi:signal transduction histidine kinase
VNDPTRRRTSASAVLLKEHAALRRVATLVAKGVPTSELFAVVSEEISKVLDLPVITIDRYGPGPITTVLAARGDAPFAVGSTWPLDGVSLASIVYETGQPARINDYSRLTGTISEAMNRRPRARALGVPIIVDGAVWGMIGAGTGHGPLPAEAEERLVGFTELISTALWNVEARDALRLLVYEQGALRRIATLVATGASAEAVFSAVVTEVGMVLDAPVITLDRFGPGPASTVLAMSGDAPWKVGATWPLDGVSLASKIFETGRSARVDDYTALLGSIADALRDSPTASTVGVPIFVDGVLWGMIGAGTPTGPLPADAEEHLVAFTEPVAIAVANIESRRVRDRLADEQAALRRVATLVANGAGPDELFSAVIAEVGRVLELPGVTLERYEADGSSTVLASRGASGSAAGSRRLREPGTLAASILATGEPARIDDDSQSSDAAGTPGRDVAILSSVGVPIVVNGTIWGLISVATDQRASLPVETETRLAGFTELVATAVSNVTTRAELVASRARIVAAGDDARRRIERNLHDGVQQRLLALGLDLQGVRSAVSPEHDSLRARLEHIEHSVGAVLEELRELSRGLHPALLSRAGLGPSLRALARTSPIPVELCLDSDRRPPESLETCIYYVVSEALTNAAKHSHASDIRIDLRSSEASINAIIKDDGVGGAWPTPGSGLIGLSDRVEALGGRFTLESPLGQGTRISIVLPFATTPPG